MLHYVKVADQQLESTFRPFLFFQIVYTGAYTVQLILYSVVCSKSQALGGAHRKLQNWKLVEKINDEEGVVGMGIT